MRKAPRAAAATPPASLRSAPSPQGGGIAVAGPHGPRLATVFGDDRDTGEDVAELPFVVDDAPFAGSRFPDAGIEAAICLLDIPGQKLRVARNHPIRRRRTFLRLDTAMSILRKRAADMGQIFARACSRSAMMSSTFSMPTESRTTSGPAPAAVFCSSESWR
jgi:hypothetical protein